MNLIDQFESISLATDDSHAVKAIRLAYSMDQNNRFDPRVVEQ